MQELLTVLTILVGDASIFILLQLLILGLFLYAAFWARFHKREKKHTPPYKVSDLVLAYSLISASLIQALSSVEVLSQFKLGIILANLVASFYLCFFSLWFQSMVGHISSKVGRRVKNS